MYCYIPCTFNTTSGLNITSVVPLLILHCTAESLFSIEARIESVDVRPVVVDDISRWAREMWESFLPLIRHCGNPPWTVHLKWEVEPRDAFLEDGISVKPGYKFHEVISKFGNKALRAIWKIKTQLTYAHSGPVLLLKRSTAAVHWWRCWFPLFSSTLVAGSRSVLGMRL